MSAALYEYRSYLKDLRARRWPPENRFVCHFNHVALLVDGRWVSWPNLRRYLAPNGKIALEACKLELDAWDPAFHRYEHLRVVHDPSDQSLPDFQGYSYGELNLMPKESTIDT